MTGYDVRACSWSQAEARLTMSTASGRGTGWFDHAACRHYDPELFFPDSDIRPARAQVEAAKKVCRRCPVRGTCLSWALDHGQEAGIWGGTTEQERRQMRCQRSAPPLTRPLSA